MPGDCSEDRIQRVTPRDDCEAAYGEKENRLGKYCEARFSACAHPFEASGDVKGSEYLGKSAERKQICGKDDGTWKLDCSWPSLVIEEGRESDMAPNQYRCPTGH